MAFSLAAIVGILGKGGADVGMPADFDQGGVDLFVSGTHGYHTYRIPALIGTAKGTLLAVCEGRKKGRADDGDIDLLLRRSTDGEKNWEPQQVVFEEGGETPVTIGNPCLVVDSETGTIWLPFCRNNRDRNAIIDHSSLRALRTSQTSHPKLMAAIPSAQNS